ncbi:MAG: hypothetical protein FJ388_23295 [Verrucomicrobia bacterium]|nr:hypothetical protein [Verrucomicrobiota bacterium]
MNRVTAIILGMLLFGLGVFLGMVGSFYRALIPGPETTAAKQEGRSSKAAVAAKPAATIASPRASRAAGATNAAAGALPPHAVEAELSQALALLNSLLGPQAEPSESPLPTATTDASTNMPPVQPAAEAVQQPAATMTEPITPETSPETLANATTGHWVFDPQTGWVWEPETSPPVAAAPVVEVYPGGWVTIHSRPRPAGPPGTLMKKGAMRPSQMPKGNAPPR